MLANPAASLGECARGDSIQSDNKIMDDQLINSFLGQLDDEAQGVRIHAINQLGDTGDELCLRELRKRLKVMSQEHQALIIAIGKLKKVWD
jgi:HEAT repeat protein